MAESGFIPRRRGGTVPPASRCRSSRARSKPKRRTSSTTSARRFRTTTKHYAGTVDVYTTLDLHLQRVAQDAVRDGLDPGGRGPRQAEAPARPGGPHRRRSADRRDPGAGRRPLLQPVAVRPCDGGPAPAGIGVQAVRLPRRVRARQAGGPDRRHRRRRSCPTSRRRSPSTIRSGTPANYDGEFEGPVTLRRALALSRNIIAVKVAEAAGYDHVAALWRKVGAGTPPRPYPSIALGVFEATPFEIAAAYTIFPNGGTLRPLVGIHRLVSGGRDLAVQVTPSKEVAGKDTTFLVTNMMRSVINEGTGAGARAAGFALDAAGKSGTTNDLRDAWFVGFTPELLDGGLGRPRRQPAARPERNAGGAADLDRVHAPGAGGAPERAVRGARRHGLRRHRPRYRLPRRAQLPADLQRGLHPGHRAHQMCPLHSFGWQPPDEGYNRVFTPQALRPADNPGLLCETICVYSCSRRPSWPAAACKKTAAPAPAHATAAAAAAGTTGAPGTRRSPRPPSRCRRSCPTSSPRSTGRTSRSPTSTCSSGTWSSGRARFRPSAATRCSAPRSTG